LIYNKDILIFSNSKIPIIVGEVFTMKHTHKALWLFIAILLTVNLACGLLGGDSGSEEVSDSAGSQANGDVDVEQFTGDVNLPAMPTNNKRFDADKFAARSLPVEVTITGSETADVLFKGALATPNWNISATPPEYLDLIMVFQHNQPSLLRQDGDSIFVDYLDPIFTAEMLDTNGNLLFSKEWGTADSLFVNWPQAYRFYIPEIPDGVASIMVSASFVKRQIGITCFQTADLDFQLPNPVFSHTPVQFELILDDWNEEYAQKAVVADYNLVYQNPYIIDMVADSMLLFLDETGSLVGYMQHDVFISANATYSRLDDEPWQSSYLAGVPTQVQIYDDFDLCNLIEASR